MTTKPSAELTLKDRLSRLTFQQACRILGPEGVKLIHQGGKYDIAIEEQVYLEGDLFRLRLPDATVTITLMAQKRQRLNWSCNRCSAACEHAGAAFSVILEEKMALGLAAPPRERIPVESLSDEELVTRALGDRKERASTEKMTLRSLDPGEIWTDYTITSASSGKSYRVALRGWQRGESYCSCPDFRKNCLGTCKHILHALEKVKRRFTAAERSLPYRREYFSIHLRYGDVLELRLLIPEELSKAAEKIVRSIKNRPIEEIHDLLKRIRKLEDLDEKVLIYPDAEEYMERHLYRARVSARMAEIRRNPGHHALRRSLLKTELLPYQLDGIAFAVAAGRAVIADDMGLGKTIQGIGVAEMLVREAGIKRVLIICPASVKSQWRSEIERFSDRSCQIVLGSAAQRSRQYDQSAFFTICNYEQVLRDILTIERVRWDLIILDEGQRIKNWEAKTSRIVKGLESPFSLVLSGTPLENRLDDLFSVVEFIDDRRLGPAYRFFNRHRVTDEKGKVLGYKNLEHLRRKLEPFLLRRTRAEVMQELPERMTEILRIAPTDEQCELHRAHMRVIQSIVNKPYLTEMDVLRLRKALLMARLAANSSFLVDKTVPGYSSKLEELDELLTKLDLEEGRKTILFSEWTSMLDLIEPLLQKRDLSYVRLDGSVPQRKRPALVREFQQNGDCKFFLTTNAGSTGLNLQAANTVINVDLPWNPAVLEQRISRAHRMGQKKQVQVFILITEETIEENLLSTLSAKHELALAVLDSESTVDEVEICCGMDELKRRLEVLLGAKPEAPLDESERIKTAAEAERLAGRQRISSAAGQMVGAAFAFLGELLPKAAETEDSRRMATMFKSRLAECLEQDDSGRLQLTMTLPDAQALDSLADALARLAAGQGSGIS